MLSDAPAIAPLPVPDAADVRAGRLAASQLMQAVRQPTWISFDEAQLHSAARLLAHGIPAVRLNPRIEGAGLHLHYSVRVADRTWVNGSVSALPRPGGDTPALSARIGAVSLPPWIIEPLADGALRILEWREGTALPSREAILRNFAVSERRVGAAVSTPRRLLVAARNLQRSPSDINPAIVWDIYAGLTGPPYHYGPENLAALYAEAFSGVSAANAATRGPAALVSVAMAAVNIRAVRLVGDQLPRIAPDPIRPLGVQLAGRDDLAKHFALSAALAGAADPALGAALGEWKELDDSLPGGSGFSFVDLAADRAGTRLGRALADPERAPEVARMLRTAAPGDLFPAEALGLSENMNEAEFRKRFGRLGSEEYDAAVERIEAALDRLPLYAGT